jgi:hypothetical protein
MLKEEFEEIDINDNINKQNSINDLNDYPDNETKLKFYYEFMENNKEFFEKIGFRDISSDSIFSLSKEADANLNNCNNCEVCLKEISRIFSKQKFW